MPFTDSPEGQTHYDEEAERKARECSHDTRVAATDGNPPYCPICFPKKAVYGDGGVYPKKEWWVDAFYWKCIVEAFDKDDAAKAFEIIQKIMAEQRRRTIEEIENFAKEAKERGLGPSYMLGFLESMKK